MDPEGLLCLDSHIYVPDVGNLWLRVLQHNHDHLDSLLRGSTSSMHVTVLLQTVCNTLIWGQRLSQQYHRFVNLEEDSGKEVRVFDIDGWSWGGILLVD